MKASADPIETEMDDFEYRHASAAALMNSSVAAQIKIIREQRGMTQAELAELIGTKQAGISRLENVNYDAWKVLTLARIARAYDVRLRVSFEEFDSMDGEIESFGVPSLQRLSYQECKARNKRRRETSSLDEIPAALKEALAPGDWAEQQAREQARKGNKHATEINTASSGIRLLGSGGTNTGNEHLSPDASGFPNGKMSVLEESLISRSA